MEAKLPKMTDLLDGREIMVLSLIYEHNFTLKEVGEEIGVGAKMAHKIAKGARDKLVRAGNFEIIFSDW